MPSIFLDNFTGTASTSLASHAPVVAPGGFAWTTYLGTMQIGSGGTTVVPNPAADSASHCAGLAVALTFPFSVSATLREANSGLNSEARFVLSFADGSFIKIHCQTSSVSTHRQTEIQIYNNTTSDYYEGGGGFFPMPANASYTASISVSATTITITIDGVDIDISIPYVFTDVTTQVLTSIEVAFLTSSTGSAGAFIDSVEIRSGSLSNVRIDQSVAEVIRYNGEEKNIWFDQGAVEVIRSNGAEASGGNVTINWVRRTRISGEWRDSTDVPIGETTESYEVEIWDAGYLTLIRTITGLTLPTVIYTETQQIIDFGSPQAVVYIKVYQLSATNGRGTPGIGLV